MGCNNTLTDDQLESMFTVTDEGMQQIKNQTEMHEVYQILL